MNTSQRQPEPLFLALKAGQPQAVSEWYREYSPKLRRLLMSKLSNQADVDEVTQDVFQSCLKHLPLFRGDSSIWTWMQRIARHEVADYYRKRYAKKAIHVLPIADFLLTDQPFNAHETSERVKQVLLQLPSEYRELLLLKYVDGKRVKEIARELGRTVKAVESDLFRARISFKHAYVAAQQEMTP